MSDNLGTLSLIIATWGWQLIALMFLCSLIILIALPTTLFTIVFSVALFMCFAGCEYMSLKRKKEVYNEVS